MKFFYKVFLFSFFISFIFCLQSNNQNDENSKINNSYKRMLSLILQEEKTQLGKKTLNQFFLWTGIALAFMLYFSVMAMINMPITKSSILYAKYGISKTNNLDH